MKSGLKQLKAWAKGEGLDAAFPTQSIDHFNDVLLYDNNLASEIAQLDSDNQAAPLHPAITSLDLILP